MRGTPLTCPYCENYALLLTKATTIHFSKCSKYLHVYRITPIIHSYCTEVLKSCALLFCVLLRVIFHKSKVSPFVNTYVQVITYVRSVQDFVVNRRRNTLENVIYMAITYHSKKVFLNLRGL